MAIAFDTKTHGSPSSVSSFTLSHTVTGTNPGIIVWIMIGPSDTVTGITYAGVSLSQVIKVEYNIPSTGFDGFFYAYYLKGCATGANNIVISFSTNTSGDVGGVSYTGIGNVENSTSTTSNSSPISASVTTINSGAMLWSQGQSSGSGGGSFFTSGTNTANIRDTYSFDNNNTVADSIGTSLTPGSNTASLNRVSGTNGSALAVISFAPFVAPATPKSGFFLAAR